ncbi:hypothetical protein SEPCBS119000_001946 [Sporothrix epigloea]|uniref:DUF155 domain-containing protein n=1 Tax=Sporothrix epigloea TaxID=1892477 RepID=A0ABP0DGR3_9PEZI
MRSGVNESSGSGKPLADNSEPSSTRDTKNGKPSSPPSPVALAAALRKPRSAGAKHSLRRVAVIAQQQPGASTPPFTPLKPSHPEDAKTPIRDGDTTASRQSPMTRASHSRRDTQEAAEEAEYHGELDDGSNVLSAVCLAESFDMVKVMAILQAQGFTLDPDGSGFESHEVVHARKWWRDPAAELQLNGRQGWREVNLFVFESGTLVGWGLPADAVDTLAVSDLLAAAADPFVALRETETLEFRRDALRETSAMRGDVVVLGTRLEAVEGDRLVTTRAQIAFSSGLARSTKLAVLEQSFTEYFESTRRIPEILAGRKSGGGIGWGHSHISQKFVLQKTGELLSLRAQLNHYRELTDALPDIFWDARAELGLEGYYEQVGRALDVGVRIKTLNQKMDYAQEIATVLREISSERHGTRLEWIIIVLITVEVVFELRRVYLDLQEGDGQKKMVT